MATALISALTRRPVSRDVAMTGEITLRGRVLPIGGLKEKSLAAFRAGMKTIVIPDRNEKDLDEVPKVLRRKIHWVVAKNMSDVLEAALMDKEKSPAKTRSVEVKKSTLATKRKIARLRARSLRKNQRDRGLPLRP
jgi:ATP-dependent Lon protease